MMRRGLWIAVAVVAVIVLAGLLVFGSYVSAKNQMVTRQEAVTAQWGNVQSVLQRRADLIPNLVATVKGAAQHEEAVFADVDKARESLLAAHDPQSQIRANGQLDGALGRLLAVAENYPNLKANQNFLELQDSLEGTENRINVERERYNRAIQDYNTFIGQFPNSIWASLAGFHRNDAYFAASPAAQNAPQVHF
ncbi:MAG TPA: LemA family protein [Acidobacteriaceae bacterium]|jgi:LemA protein|nr:LemA family protein [Acidobacteriaceae bacterium]